MRDLVREQCKLLILNTQKREELRPNQNKTSSLKEWIQFCFGGRKSFIALSCTIYSPRKKRL